MNIVKTMFDKKDRKYFKYLLQLLIDKKLALYPHIDRFIINYEILDTSHGLHLNIASTLLFE